ncbi:MAG: hypothetical protein H6Q73_2488 [Firmicutes bacterium]|nr:hypothetical protein [Bacillota bacterium]
MDVVAWPLEVAITKFNRLGISYSVSMTSPDRVRFKLDKNLLYVVRHKITENGIHELTVAAKMSKEAE